MTIRILQGDCRERLQELDAESVDSCVTDPPYHLTSIVKRFGAANAAPAKSGRTGAYARASKGFMGQTWDGGDVAFQPETWAAVFRVLKPGAHLVAFSGTRTYHRMVCAIEDAGFEIRDQIAWLYGSGFPKSHNQPGGWGTALKPALEPIVLARKPLVGTVAGNISLHGTGALNIDASRIEGQKPATTRGASSKASSMVGKLGAQGRIEDDGRGRWPANVIHDGSAEVVLGFPETTSGTKAPHHVRSTSKTKNTFGERAAPEGETWPGDSGSAARFFYSAKADSNERHAGCEDLEKGNNHPTVKPIDLMRWLCRLVTPAGGTVLDPFMGSGSTMIAADAEQFNGVGCELSHDYAAIAERRIRASAGMFAEIAA